MFPNVSKDTIVREMRSAVRFPLHLPLAVKGDNRQYSANMRDISAGGVLFDLESELPVGSMIEFTISLPAGALGVQNDVQVNCTGRVTRSYHEGAQPVAAAVIDEYSFQRP